MKVCIHVRGERPGYLSAALIIPYTSTRSPRLRRCPCCVSPVSSHGYFDDGRRRSRRGAGIGRRSNWSAASLPSTTARQHERQCQHYQSKHQRSAARSQALCAHSAISNDMRKVTTQSQVQGDLGGCTLNRAVDGAGSGYGYLHRSRPRSTQICQRGTYRTGCLGRGAATGEADGQEGPRSERQIVHRSFHLSSPLEAER